MYVFNEFCSDVEYVRTRPTLLGVSELSDAN